MIAFVWKNLVHNKWHTLTSLLMLACSINVILTIVSITSGREVELQKELQAFDGRVLVQSGGSEEVFPPLSSRLSERVADSVFRFVGNQADVVSLLFVEMAPPPYPSSPPALLGVGVRPQDIETSFLADAMLEKGLGKLENKRVAIIGSEAKKFLSDKYDKHLRLGSVIKTGGGSLEIVGEYRKTGISFIDRAVVMPLDVAKDLFSRGEAATVISIEAARIDNREIVRGLKGKFSGLKVVSQEESIRQAEAGLNGMRIFFGTINAGLQAAVLILVAIIMLNVVNERVREIGTMRAIGAQRRWLVLSIVVEGLVLSMLASILAAVTSIFLISVLLNPKLLVFFPDVLLRTVTLISLISVAGASYPAWRAVNIDPIVAIAYE